MNMEVAHIADTLYNEILYYLEEIQQHFTEAGATEYCPHSKILVKFSKEIDPDYYEKELRGHLTRLVTYINVFEILEIPDRFRKAEIDDLVNQYSVFLT